jgi:hypothetical protein
VAFLRATFTSLWGQNPPDGLEDQRATTIYFCQGGARRAITLSTDGKRSMHLPCVNGGLETIGKIFVMFLRSMNTNANSGFGRGAIA